MQVHSHQALSTLFLRRLSRLITLEVQVHTPGEQALVSKAILSTYRDCRALGLADAAEDIVGQRRPRWYTDV